MRTLKFSILLPLLALILLTSCAQMNPSVVAQTQIADNDHNALAKHYKSLAKEAKVKLQENKKLLEEYETNPFYYGRQGQDVKSHTSANIREYQKTLKESLKNFEIHRSMAMEQHKQTNKAEADPGYDYFTVEKSESSDREL